jgi:hypothetical protein
MLAAERELKSGLALAVTVAKTLSMTTSEED